MATTSSRKTHKKYCRVHYSELVVEDFQRELDPKHVRAIADEWDDNNARVIECARTSDPRCTRNPLLPEQGPRKDYLSITDGQHTFKAGRHLGSEWFDVAILPGSLTYEERGERYLYWHDATKPQHPWDRFFAKLECGQPRATAILDTTVNAGYNLGRNRSHRTLACISAIERVARDDEGLAAYGRYLSLQKPWDDLENQFDNHVVLGFCRFLRKYGDQVLDRRIRARMKTVPPVAVIRSANGHKGMFGKATTRMDHCVALALKALYEGNPDAPDADRWRLDGK